MTEDAAPDKTQEPQTAEQPDASAGRKARLQAGHMSMPGSFDSRPQDMVFALNDTFYRSRTAKAVHWAITWSDLMMTMFILFLTMYAYQVAHEEFLAKKTPEVVGGTTSDAMDITGAGSSLSSPVIPFNQRAPLITAGTIKRVESVTGDAMTPQEEKHISRADVLDQMEKQEPGVSSEVPSAPASGSPPEGPQETKIKDAAPLDVIYDLSKQVLAENNLSKFAAIDLVPDTTMRIVLTGDFLFDTGKADLSLRARESLQKIVPAIKSTPYMINVVGHTDNLPMHSERYNTNWELSVARASTVARFLIEEAGMNPGQFVVSGYSSFRPIRPNSDAENRAMNRRVEIVISKKLPPAEQGTPDKLKDL